MSSDLWLQETENCAEAFALGKIDEAGFRQWMGKLGFDKGEIDEHLEAIRKDME